MFIHKSTFELQCDDVPLLNLNCTHAPSEGDGRTIYYDNNIIYIDSAGVDRTRWGSLRLAPKNSDVKGDPARKPRLYFARGAVWKKAGLLLEEVRKV